MRAFAEPVARARALLEGVRGAHLNDDALLSHGSELAELLLRAAREREGRSDRRRARMLTALMADPVGHAFSTLLADRAYRSEDPRVAVDAARQLLRRLGVPAYLPPSARLQLAAMLRFGPFVPELAARGMFAKLRSEMRGVVLDAEEPALSSYLARRRAEGVRVNLNQLGEAVLGDREAEARMHEYLELLARPDVDAISVKASSVMSQVDVVAWDDTLAAMRQRLHTLYTQALAHRFRDAAGNERPKLVNLDMEAYRDLELTVAAFRAVLDEPELLGLTAGIALQAYLPESARVQRELTAWAQQRRARGGAPIRVRLVKGANLLAEQAESSLRGWELPIFGSKAEVDASYKKMLEHGCVPEHAQAVQLGVASHNLFDLALGLVLRAANRVEEHVSFELLEGMANPVCETLREVAGDVLVYAPAVHARSMQTAIAYLMRRLDESTAEENFLRHSFGMQPRDASFEGQRARFEQALHERATVSDAPRRTQDRRREADTSAQSVQHGFANEPDTDFALAHNRAWIADVLARWRDAPACEVASWIGGEQATQGARMDGFDPSRPNVVPYTVALARAEDVQRALRIAVEAGERWRAVPVAERASCLRQVASALRRGRGELIAAMVLDAGKRVEQADAEVSEAIDFAEYYAASFLDVVRAHPELDFSAPGVGLVTPPWNFPLAIPAGGVLALLMGGRAVVLKPALETPRVAAQLCGLCWQAGVPRDVLQLVICEDDVGSALVKDARVGRIVLTGATSTAKLFRRLRADAPLAAETGGKNALIVSARADRDAAIQDAIASAFGHAGQKCSACSLLVVEASLYEDHAFRAALVDAAASLPVGSAWDLRSVVTPLIRPPEGPLARALTTLEPGESWLLGPQIDADNPRLLRPSIKLGVREGSFTHQTELFGPVLGVMRADDFEHALRIANGTPYGLTAGLHSLDESEQERFAMRMHAGNLYVNRGITGAIVRRQPFGGVKASSFGRGAKAGGPNYVLSLGEVSQREPPSVKSAPAPDAVALVARARKHLDDARRERLGIAACSYGEAARAHFEIDHDPSAVVGERNVLRYLPCSPLLVRASDDADLLDVLLVLCAARSVRAEPVLSVSPALTAAHPWLVSSPQLGARTLDAGACAALCRELSPERVRCVGAVERELSAAAEELGVHVAAEPVLLTGRVELLHYVREQALSVRYHRFGNLAAARLLPRLRGAPE